MLFESTKQVTGVVHQDAPPRPDLVHGEEPVGADGPVLSDGHCAARRHEAPQRRQLREKLAGRYGAVAGVGIVHRKR